jgi:regulator of sirC expression with transglutaminase-like and TPR domain
MLHNLLGLARRDQDSDAGLRYLDGILILDPTDGQSRMMRAGIYLSKHQKAEALSDVQYLIDHPSPGLDLRRLKDFKERLEEERN